MKKIVLAGLCLVFFYGCEVFVIGSSRKPVQEISQKSPVGTVFLFKTKLDSNKVPDATELFVRSNGEHYIAIEKYELSDEIARLKRLISHKEITSYHADTLSYIDCNVKMNFDYNRKVMFITKKLKDDWFIVSFKE